MAVVSEFREEDCEKLLSIHMLGQRGFKKGRTLGCGGQGHVFVLQNLDGHKSYAAKAFRSGSDAEREVGIMAKLRGCPGVVSFRDFIKERDGGQCFGSIIMELCGSSLADRLRVSGQMSEEEAAQIIKQLAETLKEMHSRGIVHRDLKPGNILFKLDARDKVVISDFGLATDDPEEMSQYCGTGKYMAPEVAENKDGSFYTAAIDVWGLGAILYEMLGKRGYQPSEAFDRVRQGASPVGPFSFVAEDLLEKMLAVDPKQRLTVDQVLQHPWIVKLCRSSSSRIYRTWRRPCGAKRSAPGLDKDLVVKKVRAA
ncbi:serine/threonine-protein kinase PEPKR2 [Selaginella moellendorffii]|nr:serine/threonine-protein kinase PEPKR2 [Selaginella moellendorffii]XP_024527660.1 serine/threonine-protein kinase PEPKR2 [Selaginella moellendorffii]|eukprot:XP_024527659.1 serine/threonine-protein kinase PEPKR2 [Selaginella moellendorffii]